MTTAVDASTDLKSAPALQGPSWPLAGWSPVVVGLIVALVLLIGPPLYYLLKTSVFTTEPDGSFGEFTLSYYRELVAGPRFVGRLANSAIFRSEERRVGKECRSGGSP